MNIATKKWVLTEEKDISFEHCGRPAYWEDHEVYCSKCGEKMPEDIQEPEERGGAT